MLIISVAFGVMGSEICLKAVPLIYGNKSNFAPTIGISEEGIGRYLTTRFKNIFIADRAAERRNIVKMGIIFCWIAFLFAVPCGYMFSRGQDKGKDIYVQNDNNIKKIQSPYFGIFVRYNRHS